MADTPSNSFGIANVVIPKGGPKCVPWVMNFTGVTTHILDLSQLVAQSRIEYVQAIYIDNKDNANELTVHMDLTNQRIIVEPNTQGYYPILQPNNPVITFTTTAFAGNVNVQFLNVPVQPVVWGPSSSGGLTDTQLRASPLVITDAATVVDYSLAMTGGNDALIAANQALNYLMLYNPTGNATVNINLAGGDPAVHFFPLAAGGSFTLERGLTNAVHVKGTAAQTLIAFAG